MSEDEIITKAKDIAKRGIDPNEYIEDLTMRETIQGLLDLYQKQKEKDLEYILNCYEEIHQKLLKDLINGNQKEKIKGLSEELQ